MRRNALRTKSSCSASSRFHDTTCERATAAAVKPSERMDVTPGHGDERRFLDLPNCSLFYVREHEIVAG